ncbi:MAG: DUF885 domain-containing protein [Fimbriiglobus sp.]|nr:DUF885 domain-containing protein [Fimbriiglobus sp.]
MPRLILLALLFMLPAAATADDKALANLFREYLDSEFRRHPAFASSQGNREFDDRLDDLSAAARTADREEAKKWKAKLDAIDTTALTAAGQLDLRIWKHAIDSQLKLWELGLDPFEYDPRVLGTYLSDSVFSLLTQSTLPRERNVENAARRIEYVPKLVAAAMDKNDKTLFSKAPKILTEVAVKRNLGAIAFYEKEIFELAKENPATSVLKEPCKKAAAALKEYQTFLEKDLLPRSTGDWRIGKEAFAKKLTLELDAGYTADEVIQLAEAEAVRVEREMYYVAKQLWSKLFPGVVLPPDDEAGRRDVIAKVLDKLGDDHGKPEEIVSDAKKTVAKIKEFITAKKILTLPDPDRCQVIEMPEFQRGFSAAYLNPAPALDPKANSLYAVAPPPADWPEARRLAFQKEYNRAMLQVLTIHEAYPGHYVQLEYANRHPSLIRMVLYSGVYAEGWAVYTEQMMLDQGYGDGDLSLRLHQLKFYLRAVINAILDHKMHCTNFSDEDAMKLLVGRGFQTEGEAVGKIARAKQSSCQLSTYFIGRMAFYTLRQKVQRQRGEAFNLGKFHEEVLNQGCISVKYLPELFGVK